MVTKINEPCIEDIIIRSSGEVDLCFTMKDGQDETKLFPKEGDEDVMFTVEIGDTSEIGFGGTDNWGKDRLPLYLDYEKGSTAYDSVFVDTIEIQEQSDWCKCELINNGGAVKYTALSENPYNTERTAYFYHKTQDTTVKMGYNKGRPVSKEWCVTVIQEANPNAKPEPTPTPEPEKKDLGDYKYSVGIISDPHICKDNNGSTTGNWWDEDDFKRAMGLFVDNQEIKFIASCGDLAESQTNDYIKHPDATCNADYLEFKDLYDVNYWQVAGLRFFSPLGNHDFYGLFESRVGDVITGKKNSECLSGYNSSVNERIASLWPTDNGVNGIVPGRGRIVFELEGNKSTAIGQADMRFFSYNDYVDMYARKGGYTGSSIWDSTKGGISDEAIKCAKSYVNNNWNSCKDSLILWDGSSHGRNGYSKLSYWMKKDNDIYVFLSLDYGNDIWGIKSGWHDRMIHARTIIDLNTDDPYVKRMKEFVGDTEYSEADISYNYQYYSPNTLIWLKELIEKSKDKKIYIFTHHFMPGRVGNGVGIAKNGNWFYSDIHPSSELDPKEGNIYCVGSNALTGIEYWFINKLMNLYKNAIWFSGHSHISYSSGANFDNHEYPIVSPVEKSKYVYTKNSTTPIKESAWCIALPSLSKPRGIENGQSVRLYEDAEMGIMEVYEKGVIIKGYKVKKNNKDVLNVLAEKTIKLI